MRTALSTTLFLFLINSGFAQLNFTELGPAQTGVGFQNTLTETPQINVLTYQYYHNGGGICVGDINNDGLPDLYFVSNMEPNKLYLNKGNMKFEDISSKSNTNGGQGWATGATMVDINNDGLLDIYVCKSGNVDTEMRKNKLYVNQGNLTFKEEAAAYGLDDPSYSTQAYFLDFDKDGDLDMYLLNHAINPFTPESEKQMSFEFERDPLAGDKLFRNDEGKFVDISEKAGIEGSPIGFGLSVSVGDLNNDGYPDLYVCNDYMEHDYLYINNGDGTFTDQLETNVRHSSNYSMGSDIADIDNDGLLDIMIADMAAEDNYRSKTNMSGMNPERFWNYVDNGFHYQYMINTLQKNNGDASFSEIAQLAGVDKTDWSWAPLFADFNQDGLSDLFVTNGLRKEARNNDFVKQKNKYIEHVQMHPDSSLFYMKKILDEMPSQKISNYLFTNMGDLRFEDKQNSKMSPSFSNGAAYGDLDGDGDLDLVINNIDHPATIYRNDTKSGNYINLKLVGGPGNKGGIGAKIVVSAGGTIQTTEHYLSRGYQSSVTNRVHLGVGKATSIDKISVTWSDGTTTAMDNLGVNKEITITYKAGSSDAPFSRESQKGNTKLIPLPFDHEENDFDDFEREVLLPHQMSKQGPAVATADVNNDGLTDFYVGGALGHIGNLYLQQKDGSFRASQSVWEFNAEREEVAVHFFDYDNDGDPDLYVGAGGNEFENGSEWLRDVLYTNNNGTFEASDALPEMNISTGCVASGDYDGDGDLDLFIGNRQTPGKYPYASPSYILINNKGRFEPLAEEKAPMLKDLGMVTNAAWEDLNKDGKPDLIVTGEWMGITVLEQQNGSFTDQSKKYGLDKTTGWWFGMAVGDIDNDGDMDIVGGNLGRNYKYKASPEGPFQVYSEDINGDGKNDIVLGYNQEGKNFPLRGRQCSSEQIPELKEEFPTYNEFAMATLEEVYGEELNHALHYSVSDFSSCVFLNENGVFKRQNFPHNLQNSNWNDIVLRDLNKDGNLDIIAAGNLHEAEVETPRCDAGNGWILFGNGDGTFNPVETVNTEWGRGNTKSLSFIEVRNTPAVIVGKNDAPLELLILLK